MRALILDLDFTLLHLQAEADAIEIPGRTRSAFISPRTIAVLSRLQQRFDLILATARSWDGTRPVCEGLQKRDVTVSGVVLEDGALLGAPHDFAPLEIGRDWEDLRRNLQAQRSDDWPAFEWQRDFKACLVARAETPEDSHELQIIFAAIVANERDSLRVFRDGRKVYIAGSGADKLRALHRLLGARLDESVGIGDGSNDACWLQMIAAPNTLDGAAPEIIALVRNRHGYVSPRGGHEGIVDVLQNIEKSA